MTVDGTCTDPSGQRRPMMVWYHAGLLAGSCGVIVLALLMRVRSDQLVEFTLLPGRPIPELCGAKLLLGIECPGCGLTRCFIHALHLDLPAAASVNPAGLLLVVLLVMQLPYRTWRLASPREVPWKTRDLLLLLLLPVVLLYVQWAVRLLWN